MGTSAASAGTRKLQRAGVSEREAGTAVVQSAGAAELVSEASVGRGFFVDLLEAPWESGIYSIVSTWARKITNGGVLNVQCELMPGIESREILSIDDVSHIIGFPSQTVRRWIKAGHLRAIRHPKGWTVLRADLATFIDGLPETSVVTVRDTN